MEKTREKEQEAPVFTGAPRMYRDRVEAGQTLGASLAQYKDKDVLVLGIPRGGVPVAVEVARALNADLDVIVARKLGAPGQPELAIGAVTANGGRFINDEAIAGLGVSEEYLQKVIEAEMTEAQRREKRFRGGRPAARIKDRVVIVADDGLATGATMRASVRSVRKAEPARLIVAVPVGSPEACAALRHEVDEVVCLYQPELFWAVGLYYRDFEPTPDDEVTRLLQEFRRAAPARVD
jgi:predicted phosphoribosyltransferase